MQASRCYPLGSNGPWCLLLSCPKLRRTRRTGRDCLVFQSARLQHPELDTPDFTSLAANSDRCKWVISSKTFLTRIRSSSLYLWKRKSPIPLSKTNNSFFSRLYAVRVWKSELLCNSSMFPDGVSGSLLCRSQGSIDNIDWPL